MHAITRTDEGCRQESALLFALRERFALSTSISIHFFKKFSPSWLIIPLMHAWPCVFCGRFGTIIAHGEGCSILFRAPVACAGLRAGRICLSCCGLTPHQEGRGRVGEAGREKGAGGGAQWMSTGGSNWVTRGRVGCVFFLTSRIVLNETHTHTHTHTHNSGLAPSFSPSSLFHLFRR